MTEEDMQEVIARCGEIFVKKSECGLRSNELEKSTYESNTRFAVIENNLKIITWVLTAVGGGIITMLIKMFFGG